MDSVLGGAPTQVGAPRGTSSAAEIGTAHEGTATRNLRGTDHPTRVDLGSPLEARLLDLLDLVEGFAGVQLALRVGPAILLRHLLLPFPLGVGVLVWGDQVLPVANTTYLVFMCQQQKPLSLVYKRLLV